MALYLIHSVSAIGYCSQVQPLEDHFILRQSACNSQIILIHFNSLIWVLWAYVKNRTQICFGQRCWCSSDASCCWNGYSDISPLKSCDSDHIKWGILQLKNNKLISVLCRTKLWNSDTVSKLMLLSYHPTYTQYICNKPTSANIQHHSGWCIRQAPINQKLTEFVFQVQTVCTVYTCI